MKSPRKTASLRRAAAAAMLIGATLAASGGPSGALIPCSEILHVDADNVPANPANNFGQDWDDALPDLQTAITFVCPDFTTQIWIAEGTYTPHPTDPTISFVLPDEVELIGGFVGTELSVDDRPMVGPQSVLSGVLEAGNSHRVVVVEAGTTGRLTDINVEDGNADGLDGAPTNGGGIHVENFDAPPTHTSFIGQDISVTNNSAAGFGGGVYAGGPVVLSGFVRGNQASAGGGVFFRTGVNYLLSAMQLNTADFGGAVNVGADAEVLVSGAVFTNNSAEVSGGAIFAAGESLRIDRTEFGFNSAIENGGAIHHGGDFLQVTNSLFTRNRADGEFGNGGAVSNFGPAEITNSTFFENSATFLFGAINSSPTAPATLDLNNSIVWGNTAPSFPQMRNEGAGTTRHSNIEGSGGSGPAWSSVYGADGGGNIDADPLFASTLFPDLRLLDGSPAIDAGDAAFVGPDGFDLDGDGDQGDIGPDFDLNPRIQGGGLDMGAYESGDGTIDEFITLPRPCVVYDSRAAQGNIAGPMVGGEVRNQIATNIDLAEGQGGDPTGCVPDSATSATFMISAHDVLLSGNFRLSSAGVTPNGGVVNFAPNGLDNANTVTIPIEGGRIDIGANGGPNNVGQELANVRLVAIGYNAPTGDERFVPVTPCAFGDSRPNNNAGGAFEGPFGPGTTLTYDYVGEFDSDQGGGVGSNPTCGIPSGVDSLVVNVVAVGASGGEGSVVAHPTSELPFIGTPFAPIGMNNAAVAVVPVDGDTIKVTIAGEPDASTHVRLVVLGYMSNSAGSTFIPVNPCAAFDTRDNKGSSGAFTGLRQGDQTTTYVIGGPIDPAQGGNTGSCGVPESASGVLLNLVAINSVGEGNLQVSAAGTAPSGGVLNFQDLDPSMNNANAIPVELGFDADIDVFVNGGPNGGGQDLTHIRGVVLGYYLD